MKVTLIPDRCIACGLCQTYSELFDYHDNGIVKFTEEDDLLEKEVPLTNDVLEAIRECPTQALLKDEEGLLFVCIIHLIVVHMNKVIRQNYFPLKIGI